MQNNTSLFITKLRERKDRNGVTYFIGNFGMATMMLRPHKTNKDEWNMFIMEAKKKEDSRGGPPGSFAQSGGGYAGPSNPPETSYEDDSIPF